MISMQNQIVTVLALLLLGAPVASAQDEAAETPAATEPPPPAATEPPPEAEPEDDDVFIPTEELSADEEVTFPVDI